ncbi:MAG: hypothetical protein AWM53_01509 [Candidatus Dichloromethanomonas elyunquensis]|nr:MAG: hypothetical protein AWM53_01509 [Candidatus Dichloromethanomonas elyunquensis]
MNENTGNLVRMMSITGWQAESSLSTGFFTSADGIFTSSSDTRGSTVRRYASVFEAIKQMQEETGRFLVPYPASDMGLFSLNEDAYTLLRQLGEILIQYLEAGVIAMVTAGQISAFTAKGPELLWPALKSLYSDGLLTGSWNAEAEAPLLEDDFFWLTPVGWELAQAFTRNSLFLEVNVAGPGMDKPLIMTFYGSSKALFFLTLPTISQLSIRPVGVSQVTELLAWSWSAAALSDLSA